MKSHSKGYTLAELMATLAILGVLYSVALPNYHSHQLRSHRAQGQALLMQAAARQESYFAQHQRYITEQNQIGALQLRNTQGAAVTSDTGTYSLLVEAGKPENGGYLLKVQPIGNQTKDKLCGALSLDGIGNQRSSGQGSVSECWK